MGPPEKRCLSFLKEKRTAVILDWIIPKKKIFVGVINIYIFSYFDQYHVDIEIRVRAAEGRPSGQRRIFLHFSPDLPLPNLSSVTSMVIIKGKKMTIVNYQHI